MAGSRGMSTLGPRVEEYLAIRRALGFKLGGYDGVLGDFAEWLDTMGASVVTADLALAWTQSRSVSSPIRQRQRLTMVRGFAEYLSAMDARTEVPSSDLLPVRYHRTAPYLYSSSEISALMAAARSLCPPLKAATYETLIGLFACTFPCIAGVSPTDCLSVRANDAESARDRMGDNDGSPGREGKGKSLPGETGW
jgi:hypothetical protein